MSEQPVQGFAMVPRWIIEDDTISQNATCVFMALAGRMGRAGSAFPSHKLLAKEAKCSVASVKRALNELRELGIVKWESRWRGGANSQTSNLYTVNLNPEPVAQETPPLTGSYPENTGMQGGEVKNESSQGALPQITVATPQVTMSYPPGHHELPVNKIQVNKNQVPKDSLGSTEDATTPRNVTPILQVSAAFDQAYSHWPKKTEKKMSEQAFRKATKKLPVPQLVATIAKFGQAYRESTPTQMVPALCVWLNHERWDDDLPTAYADPSKPAITKDRDAWMQR